MKSQSVNRKSEIAAVAAAVLAACLLGTFLMAVARGEVNSALDAAPVYTGDGTTKAFAFEFGVFSTSQVRVVLRTVETGAEELLTLNSDYSVADDDGDGDYWDGPGGTVTTLAEEAYSSDYEIHISRRPALTQLRDIDGTWYVNLASIEDALDWTACQVQYLQRQIDGCLRVPETEWGLADVNLPNSVDRANTYQAFDANGTLVPAVGTADETPHTAFGAQIAAMADANVLRPSLELGFINVKDYPYLAKGDGVTDATAAISNAEAVADDAGGVLYFPPGDYELTDDLTISANVALQFAPGATISVATTKTLTINSPQNVLADPTQRIFVLEGTGLVAFAAGGELSVHWWGVSPDASAANNATYMNAALACAFGNTCDVAIYGSEQDSIPCGQINYTHSGVGSTVHGIRIRGVGRPVFDHSSLTGSNVAWTIDGTDASNCIEVVLAIENISLIGPEANCWTTGTATTTTKGMSFRRVMDLQLRQVQIERFQTGLYATYCWPLKTDGCIFSYNYIGMHLATACTIGDHRSQFDGNYHNLYFTGVVDNQVFCSPLLQNAGGNAVTINPGSGGHCVGCQFLGPYLEGIAGKAFALFEDLTGTKSAGGYTANMLISGGIWSSITGAAIAGTQGSADDVYGITIIGAYGIDTLADVTGYLRNSLLIAGNNSLSELVYTWNNVGTARATIGNHSEIIAAYVRVSQGTDGSGYMDWFEDADHGSNYIRYQPSGPIGANRTIDLIVTGFTTTIIKTVDLDDDASTDDYQFDDDAANVTEQVITLTNILPAYAELTGWQIRCFEGVADANTATVQFGTSSGGTELADDATACDDLNEIIGTAAGAGPILAATNAARSLYFSVTPSVNWDVMHSTGRWAIMLTYTDYGAAYTQKNP